MSAANFRRWWAFVLLALAAVAIAVGNVLLPSGTPVSVLEVWVAFMVLDLYINRAT